MKNKYISIILILLFLNACVGASSKGIFGTGVSIALDPRSLGTQIDDSIMDKNLDAKLILLNKNYFLSIKEIVDIIKYGKKISKKEIYNYCLKLKNEK